MTEGQRSGRERSDEERRRRKEWRVMGKGVMEKGRGGKELREWDVMGKGGGGGNE